MRTCSNGTRGCLYIGPAPHECPPKTPTQIELLDRIAVALERIADVFAAASIETAREGDE